MFSAISAKIFGGLSLALALFIGWQCLQLSAARSALKDQLQANQLLEADKRLANAQIGYWKSAADERKATADKALAAAQKQTVVHTETANTILKEVPTADNECVSALNLLRKYQ